MLRSESPCCSDEAEEEPASTGHKFYESGPVRFPRNTTKTDVALVALQQEGGFSTAQMGKIMKFVMLRFVAFCYAQGHIMLHFVAFQVPQWQFA
jgi:hypothetical protein